MAAHARPSKTDPQKLHRQLYEKYGEGQPWDNAEMLRISVIGLGAMGALYASRLSRHPDSEVRVVATGERAERLKREGVTVNGTRYDFPVVAPDEVAPPADVLVVGVKYTEFGAALEQMAGQVGENTLVVSLLNGLTSEDEIKARYPMVYAPYVITFGVDAVRQGQVVKYASPGTIAFGEARNAAPYAPGVRRLAEIFDVCGISYQIPEDMTSRMWWKFMINVGVNQVTAALRSSYHVVQRADSPARDLMIAAQREVIAVAQAKGVAMGEADLDSWLVVCAALGPEQYTSMAQDVLAGRPTETDIFGGAVRRMGEELGIPVPVNTVLNQLLKSMELVPVGGNAASGMDVAKRV